MWNEIGQLFTTTKLIPVVFIIIGLVLCVLEIMLKKGNWGIFGGILTIGGLLAVMMLEGSIIHFAFLIVVSLIIIVTTICIMMLTNGNTFFIKTKKVDLLDADKESNEDKLLKLVGKKALAVSDFNPNGVINLNGVTIDAVSEDGKIEKNENVIITKIEGINIYVKGIDK